MKIFNFLSRSDAKIVAKSIANVFKLVYGEYDVAYATIAHHWIKYDKALRNQEPLTMAANNQLPNLAMLAVAEINALTARRNTPFEKSKNAHYEQIIVYLKKQKIPHQYIDGDNSKASRDAAKAIKNYLKKIDSNSTAN